MIRRTVVSAIATLLATASLTLSAHAQSSTAFTYQGFLRDNGQPANGRYDLRFALFDSADGGNQIGSVFFVNNVTVADGLFTVEVDFGAAPFNTGARRWIEIGVRPGNRTGGHSLLSPRIELTPVPYAIYAQNVQNAQNAQNAVNAQNAQNAVNAQNAQTAAVANSVAPNSVTSAGLANDPNALSKVSGGNLSITPDGFLKNNSKHVYFYARSGSPLVNVAPENSSPGWYPIKLPSDAVVANVGGGQYDATTGVYTVPTSGFYQISFISRGVNSNVWWSPTIELVKGNERLAFATARRVVSSGADAGSVTISGVYYLQQGDQIRFRQYHTEGTSGLGTFVFDIYLTIYLLSAADAPSN